MNSAVSSLWSYAHKKPNAHNSYEEMEFDVSGLGLKCCMRSLLLTLEALVENLLNKAKVKRVNFEVNREYEDKIYFRW